MINPFNLFFSFRGRIGRFAYWAGLLALIAISPFSLRTVFTTNPFAEALGAVRGLGWAGVAWTFALLWLLAALNTKRLHDRGQSGWLGLLFYAPAMLSTLQLFLADAPLLSNARWWADAQGLLAWATWVTGATGIWFLVQLGVYPGTRGPNAYDENGSASG